MMSLEPTLSIPFTLVNRMLPDSSYHGVGDWRTISPAYFNVFRIPLLKGRVFNDQDDRLHLRSTLRRAGSDTRRSRPELALFAMLPRFYDAAMAP